MKHVSIPGIPELQSVADAERIRVLRAVGPRVFRDWRVWGAYAVQVFGFVVVLIASKAVTQTLLGVVVVIAYAIPTLFVVGRIHRRVFRQHVAAFLGSGAQHAEGEAADPASGGSTA